MKKKCFCENKGFTLIEVVLSIAILALISVPLMKYFADSMGYAVQTAEKQCATLVAQETLEYIKGQKRLITWQGVLDSNSLTKNHFNISEELKNRFQIDDSLQRIEEREAEQTGFNFEDGSGTLTYKYTDSSSADRQNFDIVVSLHTDVSANVVDKPIMYGIDSISNVIASEYTQQKDAVLYFLSLNRTAYDMGHSDTYLIASTPTPTPDGDAHVVGGEGEGGGGTESVDDPREKYKTLELLEESDVLENMEREIHVTMMETQQDVLGSNFVSVEVKYYYYCPDVLGDEKSEYISDPLINTNVQFLDGVYLMFSKMNTKNDKIIIEWVSGDGHPVMPSQASTPVFWLVCQNLDNIAPEGVELATDADKLNLEFLGMDHWTAEKSIYTNVPEDDITILESGTGGHAIKGLTSSSSPVRLFDVTVDVYREGEAGVVGKEPLVSMQSTKVE
jgi:prepilin-type N-terminal cleavage/methylation domain-containing protein